MMSYHSKAGFLETGAESKCCVAIKVEHKMNVAVYSLIPGLEKVCSAQQVYMPLGKKVWLLKNEIKIDLVSFQLRSITVFQAATKLLSHTYFVGYLNLTA